MGVAEDRGESFGVCVADGTQLDTAPNGRKRQRSEEKINWNYGCHVWERRPLLIAVKDGMQSASGKRECSGDGGGRVVRKQPQLAR
jgi:hypothetical protein